MRDRLPTEPTPVWPGGDRPMYGQDVLSAIGHAAGQVASVGGRIAVSTVQCADATGPTGSRGSSTVSLYEADGSLVTSRTFPEGVAVTALDGITVDGVDYLAVGLSTSGVRIVRADRAGLPDHHGVPADWRRHAAVTGDREIVVAVRFGQTDEGQTILVSGALTGDGAALVVTDVDDGHLLWGDNHLSNQPLRDRPTSIEVGRFGPAGVPTVSVAWSSGRLTLHDAARGTRPFIAEGQPDNPVVAQRFVLGARGRRLLAVHRRVGAAMLAAGSGRRLVEVRPNRRNSQVLGAH
ncbi:MAG TPA: hypothetical protein VFR40_07815 [Lapillicoccus sp.]|nr:hypothetical protein [Lapillicoccus sp.]